MSLWVLDRHVAQFQAELTADGALTQFPSATEDNIIEWLGEAFEELADDARLIDETFFGVETESISLVADQEFYDLPDRYDSDYYLYDENANRPLDAKPYHVREQFRNSKTANPPIYAVVGKRVALIPTPSRSLTDALTLYWLRRFGRLHYGACSGAGSSTTIKFDTTPTAGELDVRDDYYNGLQVAMTSGTLDGQVRTITDYAKSGSDHIATVAAWTGGSPGDTDGYSLMYPLDDRFQKLLTFGAIIAALEGADMDPTRFYRRREPLARKFNQHVFKQKSKGPGVPDLL